MKRVIAQKHYEGIDLIIIRYKACIEVIANSYYYTFFRAACYLFLYVYYLN